MSAIQESIQEVYIGLLGRAADLEGLTYWEGQINSGFTIEDLRENIINSQTEYAEGLGLLSRGELVEALYDNMFGRTPDLEGYAYWTAGEGAAVADDDMVTTLVRAAQDSDVTILDNKATAANYFTNNAPDSTDTTAAATAIANVDATDASVTAAQGTVDSLGNQAPTITATETVSGDEDTDIVITAPVVADEDDDTVTLTAEATNGTVALADDGTATFTPTADFNGEAVVTFTATDAAGATATATTTVTVNPVAETFTLTTGTDNLVASDYELADGETEADVVRTTADDDIITGVVSGLSSTRSLDAADQIDGGDGTDTLDVAMGTNFAGFTGDGAMTNVEVVDLENTTSISKTFSATGITGLETIKIDGNDQDFTVSNLAMTDLAVELSGMDGAQTATLTYATDVNSGSTDSISLTLTDVGAADAALDVAAVNIETLNVTSAGTSSVANLSIGNSTAMVIDGSGALEVTIVDETLETVDGSAATGNLTLDLTAVDTVDQITSVSTGSGDDTVTVDALNVEATVTGGDGTDTLVLADIGAGGDTLQPLISGFETLTIQDQDGVLVFAGSGVSDVETINFEDGAGENVILAELPNTTMALTFTDTADATAVTDGDGAITYSGAADLTVTASTVNDAQTYDNNLVAGAATSVVLTVGADVVFDGDVTAAVASSAEITVAEDASLTGGLTFAEAETVDMTVNGTMSSITTAETASSVNLTLGSASTYTGSIVAAEATSVVVDSSDTGTLELNLQTDSATDLTINAVSDITLHTDSLLSDIQTMTLTNTGAVNLTGEIANMGDASSAMTIDASGVKGALSITTGDMANGTGSFTATGSTLGTNTIVIGDGRNEVNITGGIANDTVTIQEDLTTAAEGSYVFDLGSVSTGDTVHFALGIDASLATVTLTGVDNLDVDADSTFQAATLTGKTLNLGDSGDGGTHTVTVVDTSSADTIDLSGITPVPTEVTAIVIQADGADTITGTALNNDTVEFDAAVTAANLADADLVAVENVTITNTAAGAYDFSNQTEALVITGSDQNDTITGGGDADTISGGDGADILNGGAGADTITGGDGDDEISGGAGNDTITGGAGDDTLDGGAGADTYIYDAIAELDGTGTDSLAGDSIAFSAGSDHIRIDFFDANSAASGFGGNLSGNDIGVLNNQSLVSGTTLTLGSADYFFTLDATSDTGAVSLTSVLGSAGLGGTAGGEAYFSGGSLASAIETFQAYLTGLAFTAGGTVSGTTAGQFAAGEDFVAFAKLDDGANHYLAIAFVNGDSAAISAGDVDMRVIDMGSDDFGAADIEFLLG